MKSNRLKESITRDKLDISCRFVIKQNKETPFELREGVPVDMTVMKTEESKGSELYMRI